MSKEGMNGKDFVLGTLIGGIVGAAAALFLAPKSGKELRDDLGVQASVVKEKTDKLTTEAKEKSAEYVSIAKDKASTITQLASHQSALLVDKVKDLKNRTKDQPAEETADTEIVQGLSDDAVQPAEEAKEKVNEEANEPKQETEQANR